LQQIAEQEFAITWKGEDMNSQRTVLPVLTELVRKRGNRFLRLGAKSGKLALAALLSIMFWSNTFAPLAHAQDAPATPQRTPEQQAEIDRLTFERDAAKLRKEIRDAQFNPTVTAPEGKIGLTEVFIETEILSYDAMSKVASIISNEIHQNFASAQAIAVYSEKDVKDLRFYQSVYPLFRTALEGLQRDYKFLLGEQEADRLGVRLEQEVNELLAAGRTVAETPTTETPFISGIGDAVFGVSSTARSVLDLLSLFRTETNIIGVDVKIDETALVAETFRFLGRKYEGKIKLYHPSVVQPLPLLFTKDGSKETSRTPPVIELVTETYKLRADSEKAIVSFDALTNVVKEKKEKVVALKAADREIKKNKGTIAKNAQEIAKLKAKLRGARGSARQKLIEQIEALEKANADLKKATDELEAKHGEGIRQIPVLEAAIRKAEDTIAQNSSRVPLLRSLNAQFDKLIGDYAKLDISTGVNGLTVFVKAQGLEEVLKGEPSFLLQIKPVKAGGNNRTRRNLVRYLSGAKVDHSGGFIVEYMLYDRTGAVVYSDKYAFYDGYKEPKKIREIKEN
jgi:hypothetical protein